jgi:enoyl-CoA hydratase/carnithine racemase
MSEPPVRYALADGVATITLARPQRLNALDTPLSAALAEAVEQAAADPAVWTVVVRGAGRAFCSGMDRDALGTGRIGEAFYRNWIRALNGLEDMGKVTIAVLHGWAIGGGLQLAVACDLRLCAEDAVLGLGATRHGLIPDGSVLRLARLVGLGRAKELTLLNDHLGPAAALAMGLVNWVVPAAALDARLAEIVDKTRHASRTATAHAKRLLHESFHRDPRAMVEALLAAQEECMRSWELALANRAWAAGRSEPRFHPPPARDERLG